MVLLIKSSSIFAILSRIRIFLAKFTSETQSVDVVIKKDSSSIGLGAWLGRPSSIRKVGGSNPRRGYIPCRCRVTPLPETCCKTTGVFAPHCKPRYRAVAPPYTGNHPWRCTHWLHFPSVCRCRLEIIAKRLRINYAWRLKCGFDVAQLEMCFVHHPWLHPVTVVLAFYQRAQQRWSIRHGLEKTEAVV